MNFFGTVNVSRAVLPSMRRQHRGRIVNISSVAAVAHIPFQAFYSASKAAVSSYSCALDNEVSPYGVRVTAVELGDIHTDFTLARQKTVLGDDDSPLADAIIDRIAHDSYRINITSIDAEHDISMREVYGLDKTLRE